MKWLKILHFIHRRLGECDSIKSEAVEQHSRQNGERFHVADIDWVKQVKLKDHMALCL